MWEDRPGCARGSWVGLAQPVKGWLSPRVPWGGERREEATEMQIPEEAEAENPSGLG